MQTSEKLAQNFLEENKAKSVKVTSVILILSGILEILLLLLNNLKILNYNVEISNYIIIISSGLIVLAAAFVWVIPNHTKLATVIISITAFEMIIVYDYMFSYYVSALILIPLILSTRYYSKKFVFINYLLLIVGLFISSLVTHAVALANPDVNVFAYKDPSLNFRDFGEVMRDYTFKIVCFSIIFIVCFLISQNGRDFIKNQADMTVVTASLENDMKNASAIQKQVLPTDFLIAANEGANIYAMMKPAKEVAGDFYDFFKVDDNFYFLVGDVSDKGLYAAMFMMNTKNIIHATAMNVTNLEQIITQVNKLVCKDNKANMFVTLWIGQINAKTGEGRFVNAGHSFAFVKNENNKVTKIENIPQPFIGAFEDYSYKSEKLTLFKGETIVLYTDGVTDALNQKEEAFGEKNLIEAIQAPSKDSEDLCFNISNKLSEFAHRKEQFDDITLLAVSLDSFDYDMEFKCDHANIDLVLDSLNNALYKNNVDENTINLIDAAIDDQLDNIISYAYKGVKDKGFKFQYKIKNRELKIVITDRGIAFNPLHAKPADFSKNRKIGGLGIHLIKNIMDDFYYSRTDKENIIVLLKSI